MENVFRSILFCIPNFNFECTHSVAHVITIQPRRDIATMKVKYYVDPKGSHFMFDIEGETIKDCVRQIAEAQELFEEKVCGRCGGIGIHLRVRGNSKGHEFFELVCIDCRATLALGQTKDGKSLFPKKRDAQGNALSHQGWMPPYSNEPEYEEARA